MILKLLLKKKQIRLLVKNSQNSKKMLSETKLQKTKLLTNKV